MKRWLVAAGLVIALLSGCIGCGKQQDILAQEPVIPLKEHREKNTEEAEETVSSLSYPEKEASSGAETASSAETASGAETASSAETADGAAVEMVSTQLTEEELDFFTDCFNDARTNGFLSCGYEIPSHIDLTAVMKSISSTGEPLSEKEQTEASKLFGKTTKIDLVKYSSAYLESLLHEMTGIGLSGLDEKPDCPYSSDYDAFYIRKSDIVLREITCTAGSVDGDGVYSIFYTKAGNEGLWNVIFKKSGSEFRFHSNTSLTREN